MTLADPTQTTSRITWTPPRKLASSPALPLRTDDNIQGNVLAGFNKDQLVLLFLSFPSADVSRQWLARLLPRIARNNDVAAFNERFSKRRRASGSDPEDMVAVWTNVSFTADGIRQLAPGAIVPLEDNRDDLDPGVVLWLDGAADPKVVDRAGDGGPINGPDHWVFGKPADAIHAFVCIATDRLSDLRLELARHREWAADLGYSIVFEQPGATLPGAAAGHEHFGFKDGISQPGVRGFDEPSTTDPEQVDGSLGTDLVAPGTFVLGYERDEEPHVLAPRWMWDGSFLVTRRLAQDVAGFWSNVQAEHSTLPAAVTDDSETGIPTPDALAARLVGRWRSGTPTDHAAVADIRSAQDPAQDNNFNFADDLEGERTPAVAHIRKVYPRSGATNIGLDEKGTMKRRIIRRGIPYGLPFAPASGRGEGVDAERGLLFQCYQASIEDQFVFLQQTWVNKESFTSPDTGKDPVIGQESTITVKGGGHSAGLHFAQWVNTRGSLFSLTPSIPTLKALAAGKELVS